jgi:hypothetical protein
MHGEVKLAKKQTECRNARAYYSSDETLKQHPQRHDSPQYRRTLASQGLIKA